MLSLVLVGCGGAKVDPPDPSAVAGMGAGGGKAAGGDAASGSGPEPSEQGPFRSVTVGRDHACALGGDGTARCWGAKTQVGGPYGLFAMSWDRACGQLEDGTVECVGTFFGSSIRETPLSGEFSSLSAGAAGVCGLTPAGTADCVLVSLNAVSSAGPYVDLDVGSHTICGVRAADGGVVCWRDTPPESPEFQGELGLPGDLERVIPYGEYGSDFVQVATGYRHACARRANGAVECWGDLAMAAPSALFSDIRSGERHACGLTLEGTLECWGDERFIDAPTGTFSSLSVGRSRACAVRDDSVLVCWGAGYNSITALESLLIAHMEVPLDTLAGATAVEVGEQADCALDPDGRAFCFEGGQLGKLRVPQGSWRALAAGRRQTCGLRDDAAIECWGEGVEAQSAPETERFVAVAAGVGMSCGLREDGTALCWGESCGVGCDPSLVGHFSAIDAAEGVCGLKQDGSIVCQGLGAQQAELPGSFVRVAAGWSLTPGPPDVCGLSTAGEVSCSWSRLVEGEGYTQLSLAGLVVTTLDAQGALAVHQGDQPATSPLSGQFIDQDTASFDRVSQWGCAVSSEGLVQCWGHAPYSALLPPTTLD
jgi:hypothetical protein